MENSLRKGDSFWKDFEDENFEEDNFSDEEEIN